MTVQPEETGQNLVDVFKYMVGRYKDDGIRLSSVISSERTRGSGRKSKHRKFHLNIRKNLFYYVGGQTLEQFAREVVESPSLEIFKTQLDMVLRNLL